MHKTVKNIIGGVVAFAFGVSLLVGAAMIGESKLPRSSQCEANFRIVPEKTWQPVGWSVEDGFPRVDCDLPSDKIVYEDGTWEWK